LFGHYELLEQLDFKKLTILSREANNHLALLNDKESLENGADSNNILNIALEDVLFMFVKISEEELVLADELKDTLRKTREALLSNFDQHDPEFISLKEELERLFKKKNLNEITQDEMRRNIGALTKIFDKVSELNRRNNLLKAKYENDAKYARIHKRLAEKGTLTQRERQIFEALKGVKTDVDEQVLQNTRVLATGSYFNTMVGRLIIRQFKNVKKIDLDAEATKYINKLVVKEYMDEFYGRTI
jgi:type I restriction enzyme R subunit